MTDLTGKIAFVTAAAQGIGRSAAVRLAQAGAHVIATDINEQGLSGLDGTPGITTRKLNVLDEAAVENVAGAAGAVDILVNCAGVVHGGTILEASDADLDLAQDLNVKGMIRTIRAVLPGMVERKDGAIVNVASVASAIKGVPNRFVYSVTKAAVLGLTKSVAADFVQHNVRCNAVCPGTVDTPSLQERLRVGGNYEAARAAFVARQPIGRLGTADEIADLILYLAGAGYISGQAISIDGGWTI